MTVTAIAVNKLRAKVIDYLVRSEMRIDSRQVDLLIAKLIDKMDVDELRLEAALEEID